MKSSSSAAYAPAQSLPEDFSFSAPRVLAQFVRQQWIRVVLCSGLLAIPCVWRSHIQSSDLGSHLYNAWLVQLIRAGQAPGLHLVPQYTNVLFDHMLSALFPLGPGVAEKLAVWIAVLIYFWGAFALCSVAAGCPRWNIAPLLAMCAYGYVFHMGFFNMYLAAGFGLWLVALVWEGRRWDFILIIPLLVLMFFAHVIGAVASVSLALFAGLARLLKPRWHVALLIGSLVSYLSILAYVYTHVTVDLERDADIYWMWGPGQLVVFTREYAWLALLVLIVALVSIVLFLLRERVAGLRRASVWLCLWLISGFVGYTMPGAISNPSLQQAGFLSDRISLYTFVFLCCVVGLLKSSRVQMIGFSTVAIVFFAMLYNSTAPLDRVETQIQQTVAQLPQNTRVVATLFPIHGSRIYVQHALDRACIGHCFSVGNYEASTRQFRVRADEGNRIVVTDNLHSRQMQRGAYFVKPEDLPLTELHMCGPALSQICIHELQAGELTGQAAYEEFAARSSP